MACVGPGVQLRARALISACVLHNLRGRVVANAGGLAESRAHLLGRAHAILICLEHWFDACVRLVGAELLPELAQLALQRCVMRTGARYRSRPQRAGTVSHLSRDGRRHTRRLPHRTAVFERRQTPVKHHLTSTHSRAAGPVTSRVSSHSESLLTYDAYHAILFNRRPELA